MTGLRRNGVDIIACNVDKTGSQILSQFKLFISALRRMHVGFDVILVGYPGSLAIPCAKFLSRIFNKPVVFDAFLSLYDTYVYDRQITSENSLGARLWYLLDKYSCDQSDLVLLDTNQHIEYFHRTFHIDKEKFSRVLIGADDKIFYPKEDRKHQDSFSLIFWGSFIPLQGVQHIIMAAKLLERYQDIRFEMIGSGQTYQDALRMSKELAVKNVAFDGWIPYEKVPDHVAKASVCLGIFGETAKAKRVIPNKVYEALAMKKPLITGDSSAARELLENRKNCILVPMGNAEALAQAILTLKEDRKLRDRVADNGYTLFRKRLNPTAIGKDLKMVLAELIWKGR
jgi:glycosyltransferase involved in cell wall biosynthesis